MYDVALDALCKALDGYAGKFGSQWIRDSGIFMDELDDAAAGSGSGRRKEANSDRRRGTAQRSLRGRPLRHVRRNAVRNDRVANDEESRSSSASPDSGDSGNPGGDDWDAGGGSSSQSLTPARSTQKRGKWGPKAAAGTGHKPEERVTCQLCKTGMFWRHQYKHTWHHVARMHSEPMFSCRLCERLFNHPYDHRKTYHPSFNGPLETLRSVGRKVVGSPSESDSRPGCGAKPPMAEFRQDVLQPFYDKLYPKCFPGEIERGRNVKIGQQKCQRCGEPTRSISGIIRHLWHHVTGDSHIPLFHCKICGLGLRRIEQHFRRFHAELSSLSIDELKAKWLIDNKQTLTKEYVRAAGEYFPGVDIRLVAGHISDVAHIPDAQEDSRTSKSPPGTPEACTTPQGLHVQSEKTSGSSSVPSKERTLKNKKRRTAITPFKTTKEHQCQICHQPAPNYAGNCQRHVFSHIAMETGVERFSCAICGQRYTNGVSVLLHIQKQHPGTKYLHRFRKDHRHEMRPKFEKYWKRCFPNMGVLVFGPNRDAASK